VRQPSNESSRAIPWRVLSSAVEDIVPRLWDPATNGRCTDGTDGVIGSPPTSLSLEPCHVESESIILICMAACSRQPPRLTATESSQSLFNAAEEQMRSFHQNTARRFISPFCERLLICNLAACVRGFYSQLGNSTSRAGLLRRYSGRSLFPSRAVLTT
jgi:hypothetical protein